MRSLSLVANGGGGANGPKVALDFAALPNRSQRRPFELPDSLHPDIEFFADLLQGARAAIAHAQAHSQDMSAAVA